MCMHTTCTCANESEQNHKGEYGRIWILSASVARRFSVLISTAVTCDMTVSFDPLPGAGWLCEAEIKREGGGYKCYEEFRGGPWGKERVLKVMKSTVRSLGGQGRESHSPLVLDSLLVKRKVSLLIKLPGCRRRILAKEERCFERKLQPAHPDQGVGMRL